MSQLDNNRMTIYLVQLGKLYYAGGLTRYPSTDESFSYEFVKDEEVAVSILFEDVAHRIADKCGGTVVKREMTVKEVGLRDDKHDAYMKSENKVVEEALTLALMEKINQETRE